MKRFSAGAVLGTVLSFVAVGHASAQDIWSQDQNSVVAGVYMNWQFGAEQQKKDPLSFGFAASVRHEQNGGLTFNDLAGRRTVDIRFMDTHFDSQGFEKLSMVGVPVVERGLDGGYYVLGADVDAKPEKKKASKGMRTFGKVLLWTGGILAIGTAAFAISWHNQWNDED